MIKKILIIALGVLALASSAFAGTFAYGWEDGNTIIGNYGAIGAFNISAPEPVLSGNNALKLVDGGESGTPQAYVAWINGLQTGDQITASFWCYDVTPGTSPSGRIWGHYTNDSSNIDSFAGSASGSYDYGTGEGWSLLSYTWTFDASTDRTGLVIEARTYSSLGDTIWVDDITVVAPDHATVSFAGVDAVPEPGSIVALCSGLVGLVSFARRRKS